MKKLTKILALICFLFSVTSLSSVAYFGNQIADSYYVAEQDTLSFSGMPLECRAETNDVSVGLKNNTSVNGYKTQVSLFGIIPIKNVTVTETKQTEVVILGSPFGLKIYTEGVLVVGFSDVETENGTVNPAKDCGIMVGDAVLSVNGKAVTSNSEMQKEISKSKGKACELAVKRGQEQFTVSLTPAISKSDKTCKIGLWIRDSSAGIGTLTFYSPELKVVAGLGHGICDTDTGELVPFKNGEFVNAEIIGVKKATNKTAGELQGVFSNGEIAELKENDITGVYGITDNISGGVNVMKIALKQEVEVGKAQIITTLDDEGPMVYNCEIEKVYHNDSSKIKNMVIKITDEELLKKTGGIVQGMSGSPLIKNGKLIGAVTHVLVDDSCKGYGIFAENMLETAQSVGQGLAPVEKIKDAS